MKMEKYFLVVGLGSMGKRRVRNLLELGRSRIIGVDPREDRRSESEGLYGITTFETFEDAVSDKPIHSIIISVPPDIHHEYIAAALKLRIPCFVEASVLNTNFAKLIKESEDENVLIAPSCTMYFHPAIKLISEIVTSGRLGDISTYTYHSGQYLPDWHTYEKVSDFYVSNKSTGGGREIVPFELTWITLMLGIPKRVGGMFKKTINIEGAENIDDTYTILLDYDKYIFNLIVDVVSRNATRRLLINGDQGQLIWNWEDNFISVYNASTKNWEQSFYEVSSAHEGYNQNITEQMYVDEMACFLKNVEIGHDFPNSLTKDGEVLEILYAAETSNNSNKLVQL